VSLGFWVRVFGVEDAPVVAVRLVVVVASLAPVRWSTWWLHQLATVNPSAAGLSVAHTSRAFAGLVRFANS